MRRTVKDKVKLSLFHKQVYTRETQLKAEIAVYRNHLPS